MSVAGLILAAGESRRMGFPKALLRLRGETFLDHLILKFSEQCSPVVVVLGAAAQQIRPGIRHLERASLVVNEDWLSGQLTSLQCGLRVMPENIEGFVFTLVDHPNVQPATLTALMQRPRALLRIPRYSGRRGHPVFCSAELIEEFLSLPPDRAARDVIERHRAQVEYIDLDDAGVVQDVDEPEDYRRLTEEVFP